MIVEDNQGTGISDKLIQIINYSFDNYLYDNALFFAERLYSHNPSEESMFLVGKCYFMKHRYQQAYRVLRDCESDCCKYLLARCYMELGMFAQGEKVLTLLVASNSLKAGKNQKLDLPAVYSMLGQCSMRLNRVSLAVQYYQKAVQLNPMLFNAYEELCKLGASIDAKQVFALENVPDDYPWRNEEKATPLFKTSLSVSNPSTPTSAETTFSENTPCNQAKKEDKRKNQRLFSAELTETPPMVRRSSRLSISKGQLNISRDKKRVRSAEKSESCGESLGYILNLLTVFAVACEQFYLYRPGKVIEYLNNLPNAHKQSGWVTSYLGRAFFELADYSTAEICFEKLRYKEPWYVQGLEMYSTLLWHLQKDVQLSFLAQELNDFDKKCPQTWIAIGNCFSLQKEHETALKCFTRALNLDPQLAYASTLMGHEYVATEDFDKAISSFREAIRVDGRHYNAWYGMGMVYYRQEKYDLAEFQFRKAIEINPSNSVLYCYLGMVLHATKRYDDALRVYSLASQLDPRNPLVKFKKAKVLVNLEKYQTALDELNQLRDMTPKESAVYFLIGQVYKKLGDKQKAVMHFSWAYDVDPRGSSVMKEATDLHHPMDNDDDEIHVME